MNGSCLHRVTRSALCRVDEAFALSVEEIRQVGHCVNREKDGVRLCATLQSLSESSRLNAWQTLFSFLPMAVPQQRPQEDFRQISSPALPRRRRGVAMHCPRPCPCDRVRKHKRARREAGQPQICMSHSYCLQYFSWPFPSVSEGSFSVVQMPMANGYSMHSAALIAGMGRPLNLPDRPSRSFTA